MKNVFIILFGCFVFFTACKKENSYVIPDHLKIDRSSWQQISTSALYNLPEIKGARIVTQNIFYIDNNIYASLKIIEEYNSRFILAVLKNGVWSLIENEMTSKCVREIMKDSYGNYWVYTDPQYLYGANIYLYKLTGSIESPQNTQVFNNLNTIYGLFNDSKNRVWIQVNEGILVYENDSLTSYNFENDNEYCCSIIEDATGNIFFSTSKSNVWCLNATYNYWEKIVPLFPATNRPSAMTQTGNNLVFCSSNSVYTFNGSIWNVVQKPVAGSSLRVVSTKNNDLWHVDWTNKTISLFFGNAIKDLSTELKINHEDITLSSVIVKNYADHIFFVIRQKDQDEYFEYTYH